MPRAVRRAILWGTMAIGTGKRRRYLFRVDPDGLVAVRVGNPLALTTFFLVLYLFFFFLWDAVGVASLLAGGALGMFFVGVLDNVIARGVASQPREAVLKSRMNYFVSAESFREAEIEETPALTHLRLRDHDRMLRVAIRRPAPPAVRAVLERQWLAK